MKLEKPNFFTTPAYREKLVYGKTGKYKRLKVDFWANVYPNILKVHFEQRKKDPEYLNTFALPHLYPLNLDGILNLCALPLVGYFRSCFSPEIDTSAHLKKLPKDISEYKNRKGIVGILAKLPVSKRKIEVLNVLLNIFDKFGDKSVIQLSEKLPHCLYKDFVQEVKTPFYKLAEYIKSDTLKKEIDKLTFIPNKRALKIIPKTKDYLLVPIERNRSAIFIENINFTEEDEELFWNLLCFSGTFYTLEGIYFQDCLFSAFYNCPYSRMEAQATFNNCTFEKTFAPAGWVGHRLSFEHCIINGEFDFRKTNFKNNLNISNCIFQINSSLRMDGSQFTPLFNKEGNHNTFSIYYTLFSGKASFKDLKMGTGSIKIQYVGFNNLFYFNEADLGTDGTFKYISFPHIKNAQYEICKRTFADLLEQFGYKSDVEALGLTSSDNLLLDTENTKFVQSCKMGWLNPTQASVFISRSKSWLAKQRIADRKKKSKYSIPFVGQRKAILYPKKALEAYRIQDWNLLNNLCEQYGFGKLDKPNSNE